MATLNIGGKRVKVGDEFLSLSPADQQKTVDEIASQLNISAPAPQTVGDGKTDRERSWTETLTDAGVGAAQGFQSGFQGLLGAAGDAQQAAGGLAGWAADKFGASPSTRDYVSSAASRVAVPFLPVGMPTTKQVNTAAESLLGPKYVPETTAGKYAASIGEMAPGAMAGPGGIVRKSLMAVIPGAAVQAADDASGGNPYAKVAAGLGGALFTAGKGNAGTKQLLRDVGPSELAYPQLEGKVNNAYAQLRGAGIKYDANAVDQAIQDVSTLRINPQLAPQASGLRDSFAEFAGKGMDFQDLDEMEQIATGIMRNHMTMPADKKFVGDILTKIKDVRQNGAVATNGSIAAGDVNGAIANAKELARSRIIARDINKMKDKSEWYLSGPESGLRNQFKNYGKKNGQNLTDSEERAFKSVMNREGLLNPLHNAGSRMGQIAMGSAGLALGMPVQGLVAAIGSNAARRFMEAYTKKGVENAIRTVLAGRDAQKQAAVRDLISKYEAAARTAISADTTVRTNLLGN
jgi:hypothetical protein